MDKILIFDRDERASSFLKVTFEREYLFPIVAHSLETALHLIRTVQPDILIIDASLAGVRLKDLRALLQASRIHRHAIILSDSQAEVDKVQALDAGADYYIVKPYGPRELVARVRALLRRHRANLDL